MAAQGAGVGISAYAVMTRVVLYPWLSICDALFEEVLSASFNKHFPEKRIKVNKYKHKLSHWITTGIIKSIEFRDNVYKKLKACTTDSPEYELNQCNLKRYNGYLSV